MRLSTRWLTWISLGLGVGLLLWLLHGMDFRQAWEAVVQIGWRITVLIPLSFLWLVPNTIAWKLSFKAPGAAVPFTRLLAARIAGESVNDLLPSSSLGGEPVKAMLLQPEVPLAEALSSVTVAKTTQTLALGLFILGGVALASRQAELPAGLAATAAGVIAMLGGGAAVLALGSSSGLLGSLTKRALRRWPQSARLKSLLGPLIEMDGCLSSFYRRHKSRFLASTLWHLIGMILGAVELLVIARFLGLSLDVRGALIMEAIATLAAASGFLIPGSLGAFEFGHYMAASMLGLPPAAGVLISLVRRFRELFWLVGGLLLLHRLRPAASALRRKSAGDETARPACPI